MRIINFVCAIQTSAFSFSFTAFPCMREMVADMKKPPHSTDFCNYWMISRKCKMNNNIQITQKLSLVTMYISKVEYSDKPGADAYQSQCSISNKAQYLIPEPDMGKDFFCPGTKSWQKNVWTFFLRYL